jgi:hypothetical protein
MTYLVEGYSFLKLLTKRLLPLVGLFFFKTTLNCAIIFQFLGHDADYLGQDPICLVGGNLARHLTSTCPAHWSMAAISIKAIEKRCMSLNKLTGTQE